VRRSAIPPDFGEPYRSMTTGHGVPSIRIVTMRPARGPCPPARAYDFFQESCADACPFHVKPVADVNINHAVRGRVLNGRSHRGTTTHVMKNTAVGRTWRSVSEYCHLAMY